MNELVLVCVFGIGVAAGLRSMTPPAVVSWAACVGWISVAGGPFRFIAWLPVVILLTAWALFELVLDKTSKIGKRTGLVGLIFRIVTSSVCAAVLSTAAGINLAMGIATGLIGGMIGTYGGYYLRRACVTKTSLRDLPIALAEDVIAIALAVICVYYARV